ncbi:hypothetical protein RA210_U10085 [Rubrivivax sp. A210]|nr:hypothetical protein RA210_U10085 [Rubrivivax sp. A210]
MRQRRQQGLDGGGPDGAGAGGPGHLHGRDRGRQGQRPPTRRRDQARRLFAGGGLSGLSWLSPATVRRPLILRHSKGQTAVAARAAAVSRPVNPHAGTPTWP